MIVLGSDGWIGSHLKETVWEPVVNCRGIQPARGRFSLEEYIDVNVKGLIGILERCLELKQRRVITLCSQKETLKGEIGKLVITDHAVIDIMEWYHQTHGLQTIVLRLPPVYGPGPYLKGSGLWTFMENARKGEPIEVWGDVRRDFISIHDVVTAIQCLADSDGQGVYSISGGLLSLREEAETVRRVFGSESEIVFTEKDNGLEPSCVYLNQKKIKDLGWEPKWSFEDIVKELKEGM